MTKKVVTITIDPKLDKKIRHKQAYLIVKDGKNYSYSTVAAMALEKGLKKI